MIVFLVLVSIVELLVILGLAREKQHLRVKLGHVKSELRNLRRDDGRFVDQLIERGRQEVEKLEAHYRRNLPAQQQPNEYRRPK
jgi:hypothetical protein